jgi:hypothetical protein
MKNKLRLLQRRDRKSLPVLKLPVKRLIPILGSVHTVFIERIVV